MNLKETPIAGVMLAKTKRIADERGSFYRMFSADELNFKLPIKQVNYSHTIKKGSVRGLHFQKSPALESKIVRCIEGKIYDVAVDLREGSPTFLKYFATELSAENNFALIIPEGCAHGFQSLTDNVTMIYLHSAEYAPQHEGGVRYDDPKINIKWPLPPINLSNRDLGFQKL